MNVKAKTNLHLIRMHPNQARNLQEEDNITLSSKFNLKILLSADSMKNRHARELSNEIKLFSKS
jgi:hypothetical protein